MRRSFAVSLTLAALFATSSVPVGAQKAQTDGEPRVIEVEATALEFVQDGEQVTDIPVSPGETVIFRVNNTAGVKHNFYIGTDEELKVVSGTTDAGIEDWIRRPDRVQQVEWTVPDDISGLKFGCTILGHYDAMQGTFSLAGEQGEPEPGWPPRIDPRPGRVDPRMRSRRCRRRDLLAQDAGCDPGTVRRAAQGAHHRPEQRMAGRR